MAQAEVTPDGRIAVVTEFAEKDLIKAVPGSRWDPERKLWTVPLSWGSCKALRGLFRDRLSIGLALERWAWEERRNRVEPACQLRMAMQWAAGSQQIDTDLYPFQDVGVEFLVTARQALLADEMGTGKTVQFIRALRRLLQRGEDPYPVCVVCPNTLKLTWKAEWTRWDPTVTVFVVTGSATARRKIFDEAQGAIARGARVAVVINLEAVRMHSRLAPFGNVRLIRCRSCGGQDDGVTESRCEVHPKELNQIQFRTVGVDEAHRMKDAKAKQTRAIWAVQHMPSVHFRFSLTGTPIANHPGELWPIMHGIAPGDYPTKTTWVDRYAMTNWNAFGGLDIIGVRPDTKDEFYAVLDPRFRRMPKDLVLPFLPKKVRQIRYVEMAPKQAKAYRELDERRVTRLEDGTVLMATNNLAENTRLLQFASAYATVDAEGQVHLQEPSSKLDALEEILDDMGEAQVVVAAESLQVINLAAARLDKRKITYRRITGDESENERELGKADFQAGRARVMLMTLKAGGVGVTLTAAGTIVFLQRSWSMVDNKQAEDRIHRIGSEIHDKVVIIDMVTTGTIEETQIPRLHEKLRRLEEITRDREVFMANGDMEAVARLDAEAAQLNKVPLWAPTNQQEEAA